MAHARYADSHGRAVDFGGHMFRRLSLKTILVSGAILTAAIPAGIDGYVTKPIQPAKLAAAIERLISPEATVAAR